jgi:hypothetical protein
LDTSTLREQERAILPDEDRASSRVLPLGPLFFQLFSTHAPRARAVLARNVCTVIHDIGQCGKAPRFPNDSTVYVRLQKKKRLRDCRAVNYRLELMHSDERFEASEKRVHPNDMRDWQSIFSTGAFSDLP